MAAGRLIDACAPHEHEAAEETMSKNATVTRLSEARNGQTKPQDRQIVLVLQGGGALGAYHAGVYQALHEAGIEPDWIVGTSIGAINGSLIAGNTKDDRLDALKEFWTRMAYRPPFGIPSWTGLPDTIAYWKTLLRGIPDFFEPNPGAFLGTHVPLGVDNAGFYSTAPLERTLLELVDFELLNDGAPRLTVGAAHVRTSAMKYFDSGAERLDVKHILASGALPPAFPAVRIDGELYWDGGILSNTPTEAIFDDHPRRNSLIFAAHLWNPTGAEPSTIWEVLNRHKDIQYSSRVASHISRQRQLHHMRHIINDLAKLLPEDIRHLPKVRELTSYGCPTVMHVVRLLAPQIENENHTKDVDFSPSSLRIRWHAGYAKTMRAIEQAPWENEFDPLEGVILHEPEIETMEAAE
jgi:NTE family protein